MGKATGFLDYERQDKKAEAPKERISHFREFHKPLTEEERVADLARMIAGDHAGETTLQQAREMLRQMHDMIEK